MAVTEFLNPCPTLSRVCETDFRSAVSIEGIVDVAQYLMAFVVGFVLGEWIASVRLCVAVSEFVSLTSVTSAHLVCSVHDATRTHTTIGSVNQ